MFLSHGRLPHLLEPPAYFAPQFLADEIATLLEGAPHCVATTTNLRRPGDFITLELLGRPIQLRNVDGVVQAYSNVCVHRHCLLTSVAKGNNSKLRCQYHGWEYAADGRTAHIPEPKNFVPIDRDADRLECFRVELCGQLVFVTLRDDGSLLAERLGENFDVLHNLFDDKWRPSWSWRTELDVNWKIPIENSLEGYHVPAVHPATFKVSPTAERTTHVLGTDWTMFQAPYVEPTWQERFMYRVEAAALAILGRVPSRSYSHYHFFPSLLISSSDILSIAISVFPLGPKRTELRVEQFTYRGANPSLPARVVSACWSRLNRFLAHKVLQEDFSIYPAIQKGLEASTHDGCLGAIEERVHCFQKYVTEHRRVVTSRVDSRARH